MLSNFYECEYCEESFCNKERFIKHIKNEHMTLIYICEDCSVKFENKKDYETHITSIHNFQFCKNCQICYREEEEHECGETAEAYRCDLGSCREKIYFRLNFYVRHLQVEHKIAKIDKVMEIIETNHKNVMKPNREKLKQTTSTKEGYKQSSETFIYQEDEFNELVNYINLKRQFEDDDSEFDEEKEKYLLNASKKVKFSSTIEKNDVSMSNTQFFLDQKLESHPKWEVKPKKENVSIFNPIHDVDEKSESAQKTKQFADFEKLKATTSTSKANFVKKTDFEKDFSTLSKNTNVVKKNAVSSTNDFELVLCNYKDNKRFIQTIKYEDVLLQALVLSQSIQTKSDIFTIKRYGRPYKDFALYNQHEFKDDFSIKIDFSNKDSQEFIDLIEKQYRMKTYSTINHKIMEHKKHSSYMLNKKIKLFCENCDAGFKFFEEFIRHYRECMFVNIGKNEFFVCPICQKEILNYFAMLQHLENQHFIL